jgi:hypothetical protein
LWKLKIPSKVQKKIAWPVLHRIIPQYAFIAASNVYPHMASAAMAEAMAMREGLVLASSLGCNVIQPESDSMEKIEACNRDEAWWNEKDAILSSSIVLEKQIRPLMN